MTQLYIYIYTLFHILFHSDLSRAIECSFLCYTVGPYCLSILYIIVPNSQSIPPLPLLHWQSQVCESVSVCRLVFLCHIFKNFSLNWGIQFSSVQFSCSAMSDSLGPRGLQHTGLPCPSLFLGVCSNSSPLSW